MKPLRTICVLSIAVFFAAMWGLVLRERIETARPVPLAGGYEALLGPDEDRRDLVTGIYLGTMRLGVSRTSIERLSDGSLSLRSKAEFRPEGYVPGLAPGGADIEIAFSARMSPLVGLRSFSAESEALGMNLFGVTRNDRLMIRGKVGAERVETELPFAGGPVMGDALSPFGRLSRPSVKRLGETWGMQVFNPFTGQVDDVTGRLASYRDYEVEGQRERVFELTLQCGSRQWRAWVGEDGEVIVQEIPLPVPLGLMLVREDARRELGRQILSQASARAQ